MKITVDRALFFRNFLYHDRQNNFTYAALSALFDYYDELDQELGEDTELDVIAICCDWQEVEDDELMQEYGYLLAPDEESSIAQLLEILQDRTTIIPITDNRRLIQVF